jgi:hypothetical protein
MGSYRLLGKTMFKAHLAALLISALTCLPIAAHADQLTEDLQPDKNKMIDLALNGLLAEPADVQASAAAIERACQRLLNAVPRLSPAESQWLDGELKASRDIPKLIAGREWALRELFNHFTDCAKGAGIAARASSEKARLIGWAKVAVAFSDGDTMAQMNQSGVATLQANSDFGATESMALRGIIRLLADYIAQS